MRSSFWHIVLAAVLGPVALIGASCPPPPPDHSGQVEITDCITLPQPTFQMWMSGQLDVLAVEQTTLKSKGGFTVSKSDTTCYRNPGSCPTNGTISNLSDGSYLIGLQLQDAAYVASKGKTGSVSMVGYYKKPAVPNGPGTLVSDPAQATVIVIDSKQKKHAVRFGP
jgi:hypothetical protein